MLSIYGAVPPLGIRLNDIMQKDNFTCVYFAIYKLQIMLQHSCRDNLLPKHIIGLYRFNCWFACLFVADQSAQAEKLKGK
jgi:hypothetical protein